MLLMLECLWYEKYEIDEVLKAVMMVYILEIIDNIKIIFKLDRSKEN